MNMHLFGSDQTGGKLDALRRVSVFADLPRDQLAFLARHLDWVSVDAGKTLIREGHTNEAFWVLVEGEVELSFRGRPFRKIEAGHVFGATSMLDGLEASATVVATSQIRALIASPKQFRAMAGNQTVALRLKAGVGEHLRAELLSLTRSGL